jgi:membrane-associated protease RseP (regulator of RpoE activity)
MRLWPWRRVAGVAPVSLDDVALTEALLRRGVEDVFEVREVTFRGGAIVYRGALLAPPSRAVDLLATRFRPFGYTPFLRAEADGIVLQALPLVEMTPRPRVAVNVLLFVLTCLTTLVSGALFFASPTFAPLGARSGWGALLAGTPFAATLLAILGVHEFGHYFTARYHRASVSLPYFIPAPPVVLFGTFGAIIRMRSPARDRNALFDIAAAGPLAGLLVAIPATLIGLAWSVVGPVPTGEAVRFGDPLLLKAIVYLTFGPIPAGHDVFLHPVAVAGWAGFFVTALNLFPVGQLDGGRIAYALFGPGHRRVGLITFVALLALGAVTGSVNWFVWAALLFFLVGFHHTPPLDDVTPLSPGRRLVGWICLALLVLLIPPVPISFE